MQSIFEENSFKLSQMLSRIQQQHVFKNKTEELMHLF